MIVFGDQAGNVKVIRLADTSSIASISFDGFEFADLLAIITNFRLSLELGFQLMDSIGEDATLLAFDENAGPVTINGMMFDYLSPDDCNDRPDRDKNGPELLIRWWARNNLTKNNTPVTIRIGNNLPMRAFVGNLSVENSADSVNVWNFALTLIKIPDRLEVADDPFAVNVAPGNVLNVGNPAPALLPGGIDNQIKARSEDARMSPNLNYSTGEGLVGAITGV